MCLCVHVYMYIGALTCAYVFEVRDKVVSLPGMLSTLFYERQSSTEPGACQFWLLCLATDLPVFAPPALGL